MSEPLLSWFPQKQEARFLLYFNTGRGSVTPALAGVTLTFNIDVLCTVAEVRCMSKAPPNAPERLDPARLIGSGNQRIETTRQALIEGEQSGEPAPFDFAAFKRRKISQYG
jgi:hypothetical protein